MKEIQITDLEVVRWCAIFIFHVFKNDVVQTWQAKSCMYIFGCVCELQ